jgi:hypothetical protein
MQNVLFINITHSGGFCTRKLHIPRKQLNSMMHCATETEQGAGHGRGG